MDRELYKNIELILEKHDASKQQTAKEVVKLLKKDCSTYAELERKITLIEQNFIWENKRYVNQEILQSAKMLIEQEKSGLPLL